MSKPSQLSEVSLLKLCLAKCETDKAALRLEVASLRQELVMAELGHEYQLDADANVDLLTGAITRKTTNGAAPQESTS